MRLDAFQPHASSAAALQPRTETAGEREPDGDWDDMNVSTTRTQPAGLPQGTARLSRLEQPLQTAGQGAPTATAAPAAPALPQGMGTKVDLFA